MAGPTYNFGEQPVIEINFTNMDDMPQSPTMVVGQLELPDGTIVPVTPLEETEGVFVTTLPVCVQPGPHWLRISGTEGLIVSDEILYYVAPSFAVSE